MFALLAVATANATAKIDKLAKEKGELQSKINVLEANVKSLKMQNDVLAGQVKNTESKHSLCLSVVQHLLSMIEGAHHYTLPFECSLAVLELTTSIETSIPTHHAARSADTHALHRSTSITLRMKLQAHVACKTCCA